MTLQNQDAITRFFAGKGLTAAQIAGIEGNWQIESSGRPDASNPKEGAIGLAQWEGGRRTALQNFARAAGTSETDLTTQLNFTWQELQTTEHGALTSLLAATTPTAAAQAFQSKYERSSTASLPARIDAANAIAKGGLQGGSGTPSTQPAGLVTQPAGILGSIVDFTHLVDVLLAVFGAGLFMLAIVLLAKAGGGGSSSNGSSGSSSSGGSSAPASTPERTAGKTAGKTGEAGAVEETAEVGAVAA